MSPLAGAGPLMEIEQRVQERARADAIDADPQRREDALAVLVADEIRRWNDEHARGTRALGITDPDLLADRAMRNLTGHGPLAPLLDDDDVWEIMINAPDAIFVKRHRGPDGYHDEVFHDDDHVVRILTKILDAATGAHRKLDPGDGLQDAQLDNGARLHIVHRDIASGGHLIVNIRKFTGVPFRDLDELAGIGMLPPHVARFLTACVRTRRTIVFSGAPGTGKTTLLSCCAAALDPALRVVVAEEVFEADIALPNVAAMQTRGPRADRPEVDLRRLVSGFLRMAPDVAIVGEVRDREALALLLTLSSGVKGYTTIHAGTARQALTRLRFICQLSESAAHLPLGALNTLVSEAVDVVVHCVRTPAGPRVSTVLAVEDLAAGPDAAHFTTTELFTTDARTGRLVWSGSTSPRLTDAFDAAGVDLLDLLDPGGVR